MYVCIATIIRDGKPKTIQRIKEKNQKRIRNYVLARKAFNSIIVRFGLEELKLLHKTSTDIISSANNYFPRKDTTIHKFFSDIKEQYMTANLDLSQR